MNTTDSTLHDRCSTKRDCSNNQHCVWGVTSYDYQVCDCRKTLGGLNCDEPTVVTFVVWICLALLFVISVYKSVQAFREALVSFVHYRHMSARPANQRTNTSRRAGITEYSIAARYTHTIALFSHASLARMLFAEFVLLIAVTENDTKVTTRYWGSVSNLSFVMIVLFSAVLSFLIITEWMNTLAFTRVEYKWLLRRRRHLIKLALVYMMAWVIVSAVERTSFAVILGIPMAVISLILTRVYGRRLANILTTFARAMSTKQRTLENVAQSSQSRPQITESFWSWTTATDHHDKYERVSTQIRRTVRYSEAAWILILVAAVLRLFQVAISNARLNVTLITLLYCFAQTTLNCAYQQYLSSQHVIQGVTMRQLFNVLRRNPMLLLPCGHSPPTRNSARRSRVVATTNSKLRKFGRSWFAKSRRIIAPAKSSDGLVLLQRDNNVLKKIEIAQLRQFKSPPTRQPRPLVGNHRKETYNKLSDNTVLGRNSGNVAAVV